jgi:hypothetical protein
MRHVLLQSSLMSRRGLAIAVLLGTALGLGGCSDPNGPPEYVPSEGAPYDFFRPDTVFTLPLTLTENSGLAALDSVYVAIVQDEQGILFFLNAKTGLVEREAPFGPSGDYEGMERAGDLLYVLRSDGVLLEISEWTGPAPVAREIQTGIPATCDAEGLAYDPSAGNLLIACKQGTSRALEHFREIYAVPAGQDTVRAVPAITLNTRQISQRPDYDSEVDRRLREYFDQFMDLSGVTPSGIAVHPQTRQLYVLSSAQKAVIILEADGQLNAIWRIPDRYFAQPEAIAFLPDGTLLISSEGPTGRATLARYTPKAISAPGSFRVPAADTAAAPS